ncbi:hypothetical protein CYMTET_9521, partial [Cymbomonas tetramitiformis]
DSGVLINTQGGSAASEDDILVRRMFFFDAVSSKATAQSLPTVYRYPSTMELTFTVRTDDKNLIYPPQLYLEYTNRLLGALETSLEARFEVTYTMDMAGFWETWTILMVMSFLAAFFVWAFRLYCYQRRRQNSNMDSDLLYKMLLEGGRVIGSAIFLLLLAVSAYWYLFYKIQQEVYTMLPQDDQVGAFTGALVLGVIFHTLSVVLTVYEQCSYDIFLLDWEKPRLGLGVSGGTEMQHVSVWRSLFVANEWNELQTARLTCQEVTLILMMLFLYGFHLEGLAKFSPDTEDLSLTPMDNTSVLLRFAIAAYLMLFFALVQVLLKVFILHPYVAHPLEDFVDVLTMSNISILLLRDTFAGYYLHGRSLMAHADTSMTELNLQLKKEEEMQVSARGLFPGSEREDLAGNQAFEIYIDQGLREKYDAKLMNKIEEARMRARNEQGLVAAAKKPAVPVQSTVESQGEISEMFRKFINVIEANPSHHVRERTGIEQLFRTPPDMLMMGSNKSIFFHDFRCGFGSLLLYGIEDQLLILDILVFCAFDMMTKNWALDAFFTYAVMKVVTYIRADQGEKNISRKSLIDSRFLI